MDQDQDGEAVSAGGKTKKKGRGAGCLLWILGFGALLVVGMIFNPMPPAAPPKPETAAEKSAKDIVLQRATGKYVAHAAIQQMLKDPTSGQFSGEFGRFKNGMHVGCGHVNAKNSFGAMAGTSFYLVVEEKRIAMIQTEQNDGRFRKLWNQWCMGPDDGNKPEPKSFMGIAFGSRPTNRLTQYKDNDQEWVFKGDAGKEYLGVPLKDAYFVGDEKHRIFMGAADSTDDGAFDKWRPALLEQFGIPETDDDNPRQVIWNWGAGHMRIYLKRDDAHKLASVEFLRQSK